MISIPSVWDPQLAPPGPHVVHAYTLESAAGWVKDADYADRKRQRSEILYSALKRVIPDIRDRVVLELIGTPLTHGRFLRRYHGTYGVFCRSTEKSIVTDTKIGSDADSFEGGDLQEWG
jgi:phytoene dehydrogenase-like protein